MCPNLNCISIIMCFLAHLAIGHMSFYHQVSFVIHCPSSSVMQHAQNYSTLYCSIITQYDSRPTSSALIQVSDYRLLGTSGSFGHCIVYPSISGFWFPLITLDKTCFLIYNLELHCREKTTTKKVNVTRINTLAD